VRQRGLADGRVRADRRIVRARRRSRRRGALPAAGAGDGPEEARGDASPDPAAPPRAGAVRPDLGIYLAERDRAARGGPGPDEDRPVSLVGALRGRDAQEVARSGRRPRAAQRSASRSSRVRTSTVPRVPPASLSFHSPSVSKRRSRSRSPQGLIASRIALRSNGSRRSSRARAITSGAARMKARSAAPVLIEYL